MRVWQKAALMLFRGAKPGPRAPFQAFSLPSTALSPATSVRAPSCGPSRRRPPQRPWVTATQLLTVERLEDRILLTIDPTGLEQEMLEHLNRMRTDPQGELDVIFSSHPDPLQSTDPDVQAAVDFFEVDGATLETQWASLSAVPPLTWNAALYTAAEAHNQAMIAADQQSHQLPGEEGLLARIVNAGYEWSSSVTVGENIYAFAESVFHAHAGFAVDWGHNPPSGIQPGFGHRLNIMSAEFQEIGIRITPETVAATEVGPLVITQDFAAEGTSRDAYVLGTVFDDGNGNDRYDNGEGLPNITLTFVDETGSSSTTSLSAGGYQIALPPGVYTATAAGTGLPVPIQVDGIVVEGQNGIAGGVFQNFNVKVDFNADDIPTLSVEVDAPAVAENAGNSATTAVVTRSGDLTEELVVTLSSSDTNKITVPTSVVISAGSATSNSFALNAVDDAQLTGDITISIDASATNHIPGSDTLTVTDVESLQLTAPTGTHDSATPQFEWTAVGNVDRYDLWTDRIGGGSQVIREQNLTTTVFTPSSPLSEGRYRTWVRAFNADGDSTPWSDPVDFSVDLPTPGTTRIRAPMSYTSDTTPTFTWDAAAHASVHDLWVNQQQGTPEIIREQALSGTAFTPSAELALGDYEAWIRGINAGGESGPWSPQYAFTIVDDVPRPATPRFATPSDFSTPSRLTFRWESDVYSEGFDLWVDRIGGASQIIREQNLTDAVHDPVTDLELGDYRAWVRAFNSEGEASRWSDPLDFTLVSDVDAPDVPVLLKPASLATPDSLVFSWDDNPHAERTDIWVDQLGGSSQIIRDAAVYGSTYQPATALPEGDYRVWLRAYNSEDESSRWSAPHDFTLVADVTPPAAPRLLTPSALTTAESLVFQWKSDSNAEAFELWVDQQDGTSQIIHEFSLLGTHWKPADVLPEGNYTAWLRAYNSEGEVGPWSTETTFTVATDVATPSPPQLLTPAEIVTADTLVFRWEADQESESFDLWVNQIDGTTQIIRERVLYDRQWTATTTLPNGAYQAWLRATNSQGEVGGWSPEFTFAIADDVSPPAFPEILAPLGTVTSSELQFRWQADPFAERFDLWINQVGGVTPVLRDSTIYTKTYNAFDLLAAGDYRAWVRAFNSEGESSVWSSPIDFSVVQTQPHPLLEFADGPEPAAEVAGDRWMADAGPAVAGRLKPRVLPVETPDDDQPPTLPTQPDPPSQPPQSMPANRPTPHHITDQVLLGWPESDWWDPNSRAHLPADDASHTADTRPAPRTLSEPSGGPRPT